MILHIFLTLVIIVSVISTIVFFVNKYQYKAAYKKLNELRDCPFPFRLSESDGSGHLVFKFEDGIELWCEYGFGIRCDGLYGVDELKIKGINGAYARSLELKIGQSIFPIIDNMNKFNKWAEAEAFEYAWDNTFREEWDHMKKKLDNLRVLETKSKEKEKKSK